MNYVDRIMKYIYYYTKCAFYFDSYLCNIESYIIYNSYMYIGFHIIESLLFNELASTNE